MSYDLNKWVENERGLVKRRRYVPHLLAFMMVFTAAMALIEVFDAAPDRGRLANFGPALLLLAGTMLSSPFGRDGLAGFRNGRYDEFEQAVLVRATFRAFTVFLALVLAFFVWMWIASSNGWPTPRTPLDWSAFGLAFLAVGGALPILMAEMMVPMPPEGDADEETV